MNIFGKEVGGILSKVEFSQKLGRRIMVMSDTISGFQTAFPLPDEYTDDAEVVNNTLMLVFLQQCQAYRQSMQSVMRAMEHETEAQVPPVVMPPPSSKKH